MGGLFVLVGQLVVFGGTAAAQSDACRVGQELGPGDYCTVDNISIGSNRFEVQSDGRGCYGSICSGQSMSLNGFRANRTSGTLRWRIDAVPGGGGTNRPPRPSGSIPTRTLSVGGPASSVDVARYFTDADSDTLTYSASSNRTGVVTAAVSGSTVTLTPVAAGTATVTATARDPGGLIATQSIGVTVAPSGVTAFTDNPLVPGVTPVRAVHVLQLRARIDGLRAGAGLPAFRWTDPTLTPGVTPIKRVHLAELRVALAETYAAAGRPAPAYTDARVTAGTTPIRAAHITELRTAVVDLVETPGANRAPQASGSIPAQTLAEDASRVDMAPYFTDPDGDPLTFTAASSRVGVVTVGVSGSIVTLTPVEDGTATVTVTARDPNGLSATQRMAVTVQTSGGSCTNDLGTISGTVTRNGSWDGNCPSVHYSNGEYARYYSFTLSAGASVTIDLTSPSVNTWLALRNGAGTGTGLIESDNNGGSGTNARISRTLVAGTYTIEATTLRGGATGPFTLTVTVESDGEVPGEGGGGAALTATITTCEGEQLVAGTDSFEVTIEVTINAHRNVRFVRLEGRANGQFVGFDGVGNMDAGESQSFRIFGIITTGERALRCEVEIDYQT